MPGLALARAAYCLARTPDPVEVRCLWLPRLSSWTAPPPGLDFASFHTRAAESPMRRL
jgi:hypothetical protein